MARPSWTRVCKAVLQRLIVEAFAGNARELSANADFRAAMSAPKALAKGVLLPGQQNTISLAGSLKAGKRPVGDEVASVVTVLTGQAAARVILCRMTAIW